jgi:SOS-response transcriptional repressor LexA
VQNYVKVLYPAILSHKKGNIFLQNLYTMDKLDTLRTIFEQARAARIVKSQRDFASVLEINENVLSAALNGNEKYLTENLIKKAIKFHTDNLGGDIASPAQPQESLPVIPTKAMAGTLGEFADQIKEYDCERMISPIKGADYAIKVCGDSMTPDIPNGSTILIKKIFEEEFIEWGKVFCLDTRNGAVIKRLYPTENPEVVECRSINPEYPPFRVNVKNINGWYRVLMVLSMQ